MKICGRIIGLMLVMLIAGPGIVDAQRGMRRMMPDSVRMNRMNRGFEKYPLEQMAPGFDTLKLNHPGQGMGPFGMNRMHWGMFPGPGFGMRGWMWWGPMRERMWRGFGPGWMDMPHWGMRPFRSDSTGTWRPGSWRFSDIPNLTDKQKNQIQDIRQNQQEEMRKFREDMMQKIRSMREFNHQKIMDLLTPEQKKWVEENMPRPSDK